jgi:hypothetical protein
MKLIMENWRKYLLKEYSGFEIPSDKSSRDLLKKIFNKNFVKYPLLASRFANPTVAFVSIMLDPSPTAVSTLPDDYSSLKRDTIDDYERESAKQDKEERRDCEGNIVDLSKYQLDPRIEKKIIMLLTDPEYCDVGVMIYKPNYYAKPGKRYMVQYANMESKTTRSRKSSTLGGNVSISLPHEYQNSKDGNCLGGSVISNAAATRGWGPLLYEIALEIASYESKGLSADRGSKTTGVSPFARSVWKKYSTRTDIEMSQLDVDIKKTIGAKAGENITPNPEDDCNQTEVYRIPGGPMSKLVGDPLTIMYTKTNHDTYQALKDYGRILDYSRREPMHPELQP